MSFQITVLKVLAGHPEGRLSLGDLKRAVAILISSGSDWTDRTKRLAARTPDLNIFSQAFVLRDDAGWHITDAGRAFLVSVERPVQMAVDNEQAPELVATLAAPPLSPSIRLIGINRCRPRHRAANRMPPSVAVA